jgi:hypothetical protein
MTNTQEAGWDRLQHDVDALPATRELTYGELVAAAKEIAHGYDSDEGAISFDDLPAISRGEEDGAYVQAWIWVRYSTEASE